MRERPRRPSSDQTILTTGASRRRPVSSKRSRIRGSASAARSSTEATLPPKRGGMEHYRGQHVGQSDVDREPGSAEDLARGVDAEPSVVPDELVGTGIFRLDTVGKVVACPKSRTWNVPAQPRPPQRPAATVDSPSPARRSSSVPSKKATLWKAFFASAVATARASSVSPPNTTIRVL
jgi:hypothetical protein